MVVEGKGEAEAGATDFSLLSILSYLTLVQPERLRSLKVRSRLRLLVQYLIAQYSTLNVQNLYKFP